MRDRHIFWDIATLGLLSLLAVVSLIILVQNERGWTWLMEQNERSKELAAQNREIINRLDAGLKIQNLPSVPRVSTNTETNPPETHLPATPDNASNIVMEDGSNHPRWVKGDENATDGDWLVLNIGSEPNSLNPLIDNDATASELFGRANDSLVSRAFDDFKFWEPKLAQAWGKSMICRGVAGQHNAKELAAKLDKAWDADARKKLNIAKVEAESDDVVRIELSDVNGDFEDEAVKILGAGAIAPQQWIYISFEGDKFSDGVELNAENVSVKLQKFVESNPEFKGRFLPAWKRDSSVVLQVIGGGDVAEKVLKAFIESPANSGEITDPKSPTGKRTGKVLTYDIREDYIFEEKPVFTFQLRKDVKWHDDVPFTGKDVVFTYNTIMNPKIETPVSRNYMQDCESCKLLNDDPYKVQFIWKKPYFLAFNTASGMDILPEHVFKFTDPDQFNKGPQNQKLVGTGPYKLESWERKKQFTFVRNENYYGPKPHLLKIVYKLVEDRTVALQMLQAGDLDRQNLTKPQAKQFSADTKFLDKFSINVSVANVYRYLGWNGRKPMFANTNVRRALTMLVDRKRIVDDIYRGYALPLNGPCHPDSPSFSPDINKLAIPFDPKEAVKILNQEGWKDTDGDGVLDKDGQKFAFTLLIVSNSPEYESCANLIKDTFAQAGIVVNVSNLEWSVLLQKIERLEFDAVILGWQLGLEDDPYQLWHSSQTIEKGSNHCYFVNKEADRLIERGRRELNEAKRVKMFQRVNEIIAQEQPYTFLFVEKRTVACDKRFQNVVYKLPGAEIERWWVPTALQKHK